MSPFICQRPRAQITRLVLAAFLFAAAPFARASLLVYEGFAGYTTGALAGQDPNANTVGLDTTTAYYDDGGNRTVNYSVNSTGLTLGPLLTSGGSLSFSLGTNVIGADISDTAFTGTLWSSYLINLSTQGSTSGNGAAVRIGTTPSDSSNAHLESWADSRATNSSTKVAIGNGSTGTDGNASLTLGTTYIIISSYTNVGSSLSVSSPGVATLWAMTASQFSAFISAGGTESALQSASVTATATQSTTSGLFTFNSNSAFGIVTVGDAGTIDELRYGSTLADVTPTGAIPEPATTALLLAIACAAVPFARRLRRHRQPWLRGGRRPPGVVSP